MTPRLTYANVMATIAVFIALGGTSYAVSKLPRNSVGAAQLRSGAVTSEKIKDRAITRADLAADALSVGPRGPRGPQGLGGGTGPAGPAGGTGAAGARGPAGVTEILVRKRDAPVNVAFGANSEVDVATFALPSGKWFVQAVTNVINTNQGSFFRCNLFVNGIATGPSQAIHVGGTTGSTVGALLAPGAAVDAASERQIVLRCSHDSAITPGSDQPRFERTKITAVRADILDVGDL